MLRPRGVFRSDVVTQFLLTVSAEPAVLNRVVHIFLERIYDPLNVPLALAAHITFVHDACLSRIGNHPRNRLQQKGDMRSAHLGLISTAISRRHSDRKSTRLNSSHEWISRMP